MSTWWAERNEYARDDDSRDLVELPPHLVALLDAVEARFAVTGRETPSWPDPHDDADAPFGRRDPAPEEYSRLLDPGKYAILGARAQAWRDVLTGTAGVDFGLGVDVAEERSGDMTTWTLTPETDGAAALTLAPHRDPQDGEVGIEIGVGTPPVTALSLPQCGCDACDSGSQPLLQSLDEMVLSIVDGSIAVSTGPPFTLRTSFSSERGGPRNEEPPSRQVHGASWFPGHSSMGMIPQI